MDLYAYGPMDWTVDLSRRDWRIEAALGVNKGRPFAGIRMAVYAPPGPIQTRRFQIWEESLNVVPSDPQTALYAIGNVLAGGTNHMHEEVSRMWAQEAARRHGARHRRP